MERINEHLLPQRDEKHHPYVSKAVQVDVGHKLHTSSRESKDKLHLDENTTLETDCEIPESIMKTSYFSQCCQISHTPFLTRGDVMKKSTTITVISDTTQFQEAENCDIVQDDISYFRSRLKKTDRLFQSQIEREAGSHKESDENSSVPYEEIRIFTRVQPVLVKDRVAKPTKSSPALSTVNMSKKIYKCSLCQETFTIISLNKEHLDLFELTHQSKEDEGLQNKMNIFIIKCSTQLEECDSHITDFTSSTKDDTITCRKHLAVYNTKIYLYSGAMEESQDVITKKGEIPVNMVGVENELLDVSPITEKNYKCNQCTFTSSFQRYIRLQFTRNNGKKEKRCETSCQCYILLEDLINHKTHKELNQCNICEKELKHFTNLKSHLRSNTNKTSDVISCKFHNKEFRTFY